MLVAWFGNSFCTPQMAVSVRKRDEAKSLINPPLSFHD
jgi:hypothetical protein